VLVAANNLVAFVEELHRSLCVIAVRQHDHKRIFHGDWGHGRGFRVDGAVAQTAQEYGEEVNQNCIAV